MKVFEVTVSKVIYRDTDQFTDEADARAYAIAKRDKLRELRDDNNVEYFYELTEVSDV
jgi:hypothetical protein